MNETPRQLIVVVPVFNDWPSSAMLLKRLDEIVDKTGWSWSVLLVDDGSTEPSPPPSFFPKLEQIASCQLLPLRRNLGHQRAIALGLSFVHDHLRADAVLVMDGDGEDAPEAVPELLRRFNDEGGNTIILAERSERSEGLLFTLCYHTYRLIHQFLTGVVIRSGNFSVLPRSAVDRLVSISDLWNHYAATIHASRIPFALVPTRRARRFDGQSKMSFVALVIHGLSAISVFRDRVAVRLLILSVGCLIAAVVGLGATITIRLATPWAIPGWATYSSGLLILVLLQIISSIIVFVFVVLGSREAMGFLPIRDYVHFVSEVRSLGPRSERPPTTSLESGDRLL